MKDYLLGAMFSMCVWAVGMTFYQAFEIKQLGNEIRETLKREAVLMEAITLLRLDCVKYRYPQPGLQVLPNFGPWPGQFTNHMNITNAHWTNSIIKP